MRDSTKQSKPSNPSKNNSSSTTIGGVSSRRTSPYTGTPDQVQRPVDGRQDQPRVSGDAARDRDGQSDLGSVEEKVLERMLEADDLNAASKRAEATLAAQSKEIEAEKKALNQELASTEVSLKESTEARATLVKALEPRLVALFEQVAKARRGVAICTATRDGLCSVCHVRLRPPVFQQVRHNDSIVQCESCQRVLYWVPPPPPVEPPVVHAP